MRVQHQIGADVVMRLRQATTLYNSRGYQEARTLLSVCGRCAPHEHQRRPQSVGKPYQALFGVIPCWCYEDLRRKACRTSAMPFDGFGIGGASRRRKTSEPSCAGAPEELNQARHLLGILRTDDIFVGIPAV